MWLVLAAFVARAALAAELVLRAGVAPEVALSRAALDTAQSPSALQVATLPELTRARDARLAGNGTIEACMGVPTDALVVDRLVHTAETRLLYLDYPAVDVALSDARAAMLCLRDPLDASRAWRVAFLRGVAALDRGQEEVARAAFEEAVAVSPGTPWDDDFAPAGRPVYEAAAAAVTARPPISLRVVPLPPGYELRIDGRAEPLPPRGRLLDVLVAPGEHLLQVDGPGGVTTTRLDLTGGDATVVLPRLLTEEAAWWAADPSLAYQLDAALLPFLTPGAPVTVVLPEETWRRTAGVGWTRIARHPPPLTRRSPTNAIVAGSGASLFVGGAALGVASYIQGSTAATRATESTGWTEYTTHLRDYSHARTRLLIGEGIGALGAVAFTVGLTLPLGPAPTRVTAPEPR